MRLLQLPRLLFAVVLATGGLSVGCAGKMAAPSKAVERAPEGEKLEYERILGSFAADSHGIIYLNPRVVEGHLLDKKSEYGYVQLAQQFERMGARRGTAAVNLNWGASLWKSSPEKAYKHIMHARKLFAELGEAQGLAYTYEWLGYMLQKSGAADLAAQHYSVALRLFEMLDDEASKKRIVGYAEP